MKNKKFPAQKKKFLPLYRIILLSYQQSKIHDVVTENYFMTVHHTVKFGNIYKNYTLPD